MAWREQYLAGALLQSILDELGYRPVIVFPRADDELHLIVAGQLAKVLVAVARHFSGARSFQIDHATDTFIGG
ncbi:hypothetical protein D3C81_1416180 [compost metagenome]